MRIDAGLITSWVLGLSSLTATEKWESFEGLAADLYTTGPDHDGLWERAGGSDADLPRNGSGRSRWHETLSKMWHGGGHLRADQLLREMQKDYPMNEQLRFLANDTEFGAVGRGG
jgi:Effector-associated domain 1